MTNNDEDSISHLLVQLGIEDEQIDQVLQNKLSSLSIHSIHDLAKLSTTDELEKVGITKFHSRILLEEAKKLTTVTTTTTSIITAKKVAPSFMKYTTPKPIAYHKIHSDQIYRATLIGDEIVSVDSSGQIYVVDMIYSKSIYDEMIHTKKLPLPTSHTVTTTDIDSKNEKALADCINLSTSNPRKLEPIIHDTSRITRCVVSNDEKFFISIDTNGLLVVWDVSTWKIDRQCNLTGDMWAVEINHTDSRIVCGCNIHLRLLDFSTLIVMDEDLTHSGTILGIGRHPCQDKFITGDGNGQVCVFDISTDKFIQIFTAKVSGWIGGVAFISDSLIVAGGTDKILYVWDINVTKQQQDSKSIKCLKEVPSYERIRSLSVSYDGSVLAAGIDQGHVGLWSIPELEEKAMLKCHQRDTSVTFSRKKPFLVSSGSDHAVVVYCFET
jgi:WD40 repeat protein